MTKIERIKIEKEKKEKRDRELKELLMKCDICKLSDFNEVFILKSDRFTKNCPKKDSKARRVCGGCARWLFKNRYYDFGTYWRNFFFSQLHIKDKNRGKYMVIHA